jgi:hypothetical protein
MERGAAASRDDAEDRSETIHNKIRIFDHSNGKNNKDKNWKRATLT